MYLSIDIGGTLIKPALMDRSGQIFKKESRPISRKSIDEFDNILFQVIDYYFSTDIRGISVSCPGAVDTNTGTIYNGGAFPFQHNVNLKSKLEHRYGVEVAIENDGRCAALAELWLGSVQGKRDAVVLVLGSGVGGGIILDGKLRHGGNLLSGEMSYIMDGFGEESQKATFFGFTGSAVEMIKRINTLKQEKELLDGKKAFKYINSGDEEANNIFDEFCQSIGTQILNLQYILDPEIIAIGGGISAQQILIERIKLAIEELKRVNPMHVAKPNVICCEFQNDANLYGALYNLLSNVDKLLKKTNEVL
ncbi:ROK family protein [Terribacillus saccharophilus]|uniref:ROK family protein n=2 Tax=Terribacillus saccharophilus TaxID=361277 RepID=UPI000C9CC21A|nr:ROK family protein [Terribacillus goriensis]